MGDVGFLGALFVIFAGIGLFLLALPIILFFVGYKGENKNKRGRKWARTGFWVSLSIFILALVYVILAI